MKLSQLFVKTSKEQIQDEKAANAQLLMRGGFIHKVMAGTYTFLPMGLRVLNKIENIVRKHMDTIGTEVLMTALAPKKIWETTKRIDSIDVLMKTGPANDIAAQEHPQEYILNCTHEDNITPIVQKYAQSYKDLPVTVYQIQNKFRNESRAKSGLLRGREFRMKDLYSFHADKASMMEYYKSAEKAYLAVFDELGLGDDTYVTLASGGDFTEEYSHEFQTACHIGEDLLFLPSGGSVAFNKEVAPSKVPDYKYSTELGTLEDIYGENVVSVQRLCDFLSLPVEQTVKTMLYKDGEGKLYAVAVRGDYEVNEIKLAKATGITGRVLLSDQEIFEHTGAERGYAGIINLPEAFTLICDDALESMTNMETGTNKTHYHTINVNWGRDLQKPTTFYDIKDAKPGDLDPETGKPYTTFASCEVGNIFPLESKFSDAFGYTYIGKDGKSHPLFMGSYGIGTSRVMGVLVEKFHDEKGIIWPENVAPFTHVIIGIGDEGLAQAEKLYHTMKDAGYDVAFDDRNVGPGFKFKDADLIGYPTQLVIGKKTLAHNQSLEKIDRKTGERTLIEIATYLKDISS